MIDRPSETAGGTHFKFAYLFDFPGRADVKRSRHHDPFGRLEDVRTESIEGDRGFQGSKGLSAHLPKLVIAVQTEYRPLGSGMLCSRHLTSKSPDGKRPWCLVMNIGKAVPSETPDEEVGLDRLG